jgi:hypothetical protein
MIMLHGCLYFSSQVIDVTMVCGSDFGWAVIIIPVRPVSGCFPSSPIGGKSILG